MIKVNLSRFTLRVFNHLPTAEKRITLPTLFTIARIAIVPLVIVAMINAWWASAFFFFVFACLTDLIDGFLARLLNEKTFLGAFLDPIADKLLLISCFFTLAFISTPLFSVPRLFVFFVISKELLQLVGAVIVYCARGYLNIQPTLLGKLTTSIQMFFIVWLFSCYFLCWIPIKTYYVMLFTMICFIGASFIQYVNIGLHILTNKKQ